MYLLQDLETVNTVTIRGLEVDGKLCTVNKRKGGHVQTRETIISSNITSETPVIPMGAVQTNNVSPFSMFFLTSNYILPISLLSLLLLLSIIVSSIALCRYIRLQKGQYLSQEGAGDVAEEDNSGGHWGESRREWIL